MPAVLAHSIFAAFAELESSVLQSVRVAIGSCIWEHMWCHHSCGQHRRYTIAALKITDRV